MSFGKLTRQTLFGIQIPRLTRNPDGKLKRDAQCPDANPCNVLCTVTGTSLCTGCLLPGGTIPPAFASGDTSYKWVSGTNLDSSFCMNRDNTPVIGIPPPPLPQTGGRDCCTWIGSYGGAAEFDVWNSNNCTILHAPPPPFAVAIGPNAYLWRTLGTTWNFAAVAAVGFGLSAFIGPYFSGSVVSPNCMDPFTIVNTITTCGSGGVIIAGGVLSGTPGGC